jgi:multidrug efflux pump subunit AcrB
MDYPTVHAEVNRDRAGQFGLTMSNVAQSYETAHQSELLA